MEEITFIVSPRNVKAERVRPRVLRMMRAIRMMSGLWIHQGHIADEMDDDRFGIITSYLVNFLGLRMYEDWRYEEGMIRVQLHHLPRQSRQTVEAAIALLTKEEIECGMPGLLRSLVDKHPFPNGGEPSLVGFYTETEAKMFGFKAEHRGLPGLSLEASALVWISEPDRWLSTREFRKLTRSSRLAASILSLKKLGYEISVRYVPNGDGTYRAKYHYFEDAVERAKWFAENHAGMSREQALAAMQAESDGCESEGEQKAQAGGAKPTQEVPSRFGVPATLLNEAFPNAKSKSVVEFKGLHYVRRFRPQDIDNAGKVLSWTMWWDVARPATVNLGSTTRETTVA